MFKFLQKFSNMNKKKIKMIKNYKVMNVKVRIEHLMIKNKN